MRRIRTMGLGALMALALMAVPAGASATGGIQSDGFYPGNGIILKGASVKGSHQIYLNPYNEKIDCKTKFESQLAGPASTVIATAMNWGECTKLTPNGCRFEFHPGTQNSFDIGPPGCGPIKTTAGVCKALIPSQTSLAATYTNVGEGNNSKVMIDSNAVIKYTFESCKGSGSWGVIDGEWELTGSDASGEPTGISAVDTFGGLYLAGESEPRFEAENYSFPVLGQQDPKDRIEFYSPVLNSTLECGSLKFDQQVWNATPELSLDAQYGSCSLNVGGTATVTTNGCSHVLGVDTAGPYAGSFDLACGASALELLIDPPVVGTCTIKIPTQSLASVTYESLGTGASRTIAAEIDGKDISYSMTEKSFGCFGGAGAHGDGVLEGGLTLGSL